MDSLRGRVALVTGASSGIGQACARALVERGARVLLAARQRERLDALYAQLEQSGAGTAHAKRGEVHAFTLDVRDRAAVAALERDLAERELLPDVLINNAELSRADSARWRRSASCSPGHSWGCTGSPAPSSTSPATSSRWSASSTT